MALLRLGSVLADPVVVLSGLLRSASSGFALWISRASRLTSRQDNSYAFLVAPFAPSMLAAVDLAKAEHAHPLGVVVPDNFATDFDLGGHGFPLKRAR
jgi:hypothetical protein